MLSTNLESCQVVGILGEYAVSMSFNASCPDSDPSVVSRK